MPWVSTAQRYYLDNLNWTLVTYGSIAALAYSFNLRRRNDERALQVARLETELVEARLGALAGELQPEFLYGALNTVSSLVHTNPDRADRVISKLADFLRLVLNRTGSIVGPLQDELECVERYLEIEQMRNGPGLSVQLEIDPETLDAEFPPMTLHSIVELLLEQPSGEPQSPSTALTIESSQRDGNLSVRISRTVEDTVPSQVAQTRRASRLAAIRDRLRDLYGDKNDVGLNLDERSSAISISVPFRTVMVAE
jgi:LytS/YehU family sensor histidine kinase